MKTKWAEMSTADVQRRIEESQSFTNRHLNLLDVMIQSYTGIAYDTENRLSDPEKHAFAWVSWILDQTTHSNPKAMVDAMSGGVGQTVAEAGETAMNEWLEQTNWRAVAQKAALDAQFAHGILVTTLVENPNLQVAQLPKDFREARAKKGLGEAVIPQQRRISQKHFGLQRSAENWDESEFMWHKEEWTVDRLRRLVKESPGDGWLESAIASYEGIDDPLNKESLNRNAEK